MATFFPVWETPAIGYTGRDKDTDLSSTARSQAFPDEREA
jgi:hypothetical protein